mmetsp:Transcript_24785/g.37695  ORF Transcript_24785/g.37695 Transcript_24785/m.37695 type:complete len:159 (+) Transcript_24785:434-910(+)
MVASTSADPWAAEATMELPWVRGCLPQVQAEVLVNDEDPFPSIIVPRRFSEEKCKSGLPVQAPARRRAAPPAPPPCRPAAAPPSPWADRSSSLGDGGESWRSGAWPPTLERRRERGVRTQSERCKVATNIHSSGDELISDHSSGVSEVTHELRLNQFN